MSDEHPEMERVLAILTERIDALESILALPEDRRPRDAEYRARTREALGELVYVRDRVKGRV